MIKRRGLVIQLLILVGFICMASISVVNAQEPTQIVSLNLGGFILGVPGVEYQNNIDDSAAWAIRGNYMSIGTGDWKWSATGVGGSYKGFFSPTAPAGGYWDVGVDILMMKAEYKYTTLTSKTETASSTFFAPGAGAGYQWLFENFGVSAGAKIVYFAGSIEIAGTKLPLSGVTPGGVLQLGYAW